MNIHLYRLSLTKRQKTPLLEIMDQGVPQPNRKEYLAELFSRKISYDA